MPSSRAMLLLTAFCIAGCDARDPCEADKPRAGKLSTGTSETLQEKETRTPAQKKLDSHIVLALKKRRGEPPFDKPTQLDPDLEIEPDGQVLVDLTATVSGELLTHIETEGGKVINSFEASRAIRALMPLMRVEMIASRADVQFISPAAKASTNAGGPAQSSVIKP